MPVSTTHVISSAIAGVGTTKGARQVNWGVARSIVTAWIITIPAAMFIAAITYLVISTLGWR
jgi:PiT family inorganic phosphate transporter